MPEVTVVIPCFNYGRFLDEAVESVLSQSRQDFEIVIVDDGSTDPDTCSLLDNYQRPKTTVLRTENRGPAAARNTGIRASSGRYVVTLDADDRLHRRYLEKTTAVLDADAGGRLGFVSTLQRRFGDADDTLEAGDGSLLTLAMVNNIHASALFRRKAWEQVDGYRESFTGWEDWNLWLNIAGVGYRWEIVNEELFFYRKHGETRSSNSQRNRQELFGAVLRDNAAFYLEHHQDILKSCFEKIAELENVWREKDDALADNETLSDQLQAEQESHKEALAKYRQLEDFCRTLTSDLEETQESQRKAEQEYRGLEQEYQGLEQEYQGLKQEYRGLEQEYLRHEEEHRRLEDEYRRLEKYCRGLEADLKVNDGG